MQQFFNIIFLCINTETKFRNGLPSLSKPRVQAVFHTNQFDFCYPKTVTAKFGKLACCSMLYISVRVAFYRQRCTRGSHVRLLYPEIVCNDNQLNRCLKNGILEGINQ